MSEGIARRRRSPGRITGNPSPKFARRQKSRKTAVFGSQNSKLRRRWKASPISSLRGQIVSPRYPDVAAARIQQDSRRREILSAQLKLLFGNSNIGSGCHPARGHNPGSPSMADRSPLFRPWVVALHYSGCGCSECACAGLQARLDCVHRAWPLASRVCDWRQPGWRWLGRSGSPLISTKPISSISFSFFSSWVE